jgi:hypothetical protein
MSTDDERPESEVPAVPRTRAEMRAAREAAEAEAAAAADAAPEVSEAVDASPEASEVVEAAPEVSEPASASPEASEADHASPVPERGAQRRDEGPPRDRRFLVALGAVLGILVLVGATLGFVSLTQGPRISEVQVDAEHAIEASGSRLILTANQSLSSIDETQVSIEPAAPFTLDASGRGVGIRFTVPLDDATTYTVSVADVTGAGGGPTSTLTTSFTTPESTLFLLKRDADGEDKIFRTDLAGQGTAVFAADKINDFRVTSNRLVVSIEEDEVSKLLVMDRDGSDERELDLPDVGYIGSIQVSDRGGLVGYTYSDQELSDTQGRASVLVTQPLSGEGEPEITEVAGTEANVLVWQFVPDSAAMLFIDFDGALSLIDHSSDAGVQSMGLATDILGVSRGTYTALVQRLDLAIVELNLADGSEEPLAASDPDYGTASSIVPFPGGTLRHVASFGDDGIPNGQAVVRVDDDGTATVLVEVGATDSILQECASPSGQYAAIAIAPDLADNPFDQMLLPLPENVETHIIDLRTGEEVVPLTGFDASWCATAPQF